MWLPRAIRPLTLVLMLTLLALTPVRAVAQTEEVVDQANEVRDAALARVREIDEQLDNALHAYEDVNGSLEQLSYRIATVTETVRDYESDIRSLRAERRRLVVEAYMTNDEGLLGAALSASSIQDVITSRYILEKAAGADVATTSRLVATRRDVELLKDDLVTDQARVSELRTTAEEVVHTLDALQEEAAHAYALAKSVAAEELREYEAEIARVAAIEAARQRGSAAGVDGTITPGFVCPLSGAKYIDSWGFPRSGGRTHKGTDMFAARGTVVVAAGDGAIKLKTNNLGGTVAFVRADHGVTYYYAHLDGYVQGVVDGQRVVAGQAIAYVGNSGNAIGTSPHLHLQVHPAHGAPVNPYPTLRRGC